MPAVLRRIARRRPSGLKRRDVGDDRQDIVFAQIRDDGLHHLGAGADAREVLEIVELPRKITRRAARE